MKICRTTLKINNLRNVTGFERKSPAFHIEKKKEIKTEGGNKN